MNRSNRFSLALHVLAHLAERVGQPATSEQLAGCTRTNPVVIRRTMAGLRESGLVSSARGHGGGWMLTRPAAEITLRDVYAALDERLLLATGMPRTAHGCPIEATVAGALDDFLEDAEALLAARLGRITLADLSGHVRGQTEERVGADG